MVLTAADKIAASAKKKKLQKRPRLKTASGSSSSEDEDEDEDMVEAASRLPIEVEAAEALTKARDFLDEMAEDRLLAEFGSRILSGLEEVAKKHGDAAATQLIEDVYKESGHDAAMESFKQKLAEVEALLAEVNGRDDARSTQLNPVRAPRPASMRLAALLLASFALAHAWPCARGSSPPSSSGCTRSCPRAMRRRRASRSAARRSSPH